MSDSSTLKVFVWKCPACGALANDHRGAKPSENCRSSADRCMGFICECDGDTPEVHGTVMSDRCRNANCYHCGWGGTFPKTPKGLAPWEKTALAAGWTPPKERGL